MAVDPKEVEAMSRLRKILAGEVVDSPVVESKRSTSLNESGSVDATTDMKAILNAFYAGANNSVAELNELAVESRPLRSAMITSKTETGVRMGSWEIKVTEDKTGKLYDVVNVNTGDAIAMDLTLYETALSLTKLLSFHVGINSPQIKKVLALEEDYARFRQDAAVFKHRAKQRQAAGDTFRAAVAEDRFQENRDQAIKLREELISYSKTL